ncbi:MAG: hypothetical protein AAF081_05640 [Actinomycetota bacterium]
MTRRLAACLLVAIVAVGFGVPAAGQSADADDTAAIEDAQGVSDGPFVRVSGTNAARPGERVVIVVGGFDADFVTTQVCGNLGRRGSIDCNQVGSDSIETLPDDTRGSWFTITEPPLPCPCVLRTADSSNSEVALAEFTVLGHPFEVNLLDNEAIPNPFVVDIDVVRADEGRIEAIKSSLGSATDYDVTVSVRNQWVQPVANLTVTAWAARRDSSTAITTVTLDAPETLGSSQAWQQTVRATLPAIVDGETVWRVEVTAPSVDRVERSTTTSYTPWLLYVLVAVLIVDLVVLAARFVLRRLRGDDTEADPPEPTTPIEPGEIIDVRETIDLREPVAPAAPVTEVELAPGTPDRP